MAGGMPQLDDLEERLADLRTNLGGIRALELARFARPG